MVCPALHDLQLGQLLQVGVDDLAETTQEPAAIGGRDLAPGGACGVRAGDGLIGLVRIGLDHRLDQHLGCGVDDVVRCGMSRAVLLAHSLSNPLTRSQSVTAVLNACSSMSAACT